MALKIDLRPGQSLMIGEATVKLVKKSGQLACLIIEADKNVIIRRPEDGERSQQAPSLALQA